MFRQVLGRIYRAGAKTPATQRLIVAKDTVEEEVMSSLQAKLDCLDALTDDDLSLVK